MSSHPWMAKVSARRGSYPTARAASTSGPDLRWAAGHCPVSVSALTSARSLRSVATRARVAASPGGGTTFRSAGTSAQRSSAGSACTALTASTSTAPSARESTLGERLHRAAWALETGHPQVQHLGGLIAADVRRLAGIRVHRRPAPAVVVEQPRNARPGLLGELASGAQKSPVNRVAALTMFVELPDVGELFACPAAQPLAARRDPLHRDRPDEGDRRQRRAYRQRSSSPDRIVAEHLQ